MIKIAHIADTHIKNLKYHYEYKIIFEELYDTLREEKPDYIVHWGTWLTQRRSYRQSILNSPQAL